VRIRVDIIDCVGLRRAALALEAEQQLIRLFQKRRNVATHVQTFAHVAAWRHAVADKDNVGDFHLLCLHTSTRQGDWGDAIRDFSERIVSQLKQRSRLVTFTASQVPNLTPSKDLSSDRCEWWWPVPQKLYHLE